jgi:hypothetical protein
MATDTRKTGIDSVGTLSLDSIFFPASGLGCALLFVLSRDGKRPDAYGKVLLASYRRHAESARRRWDRRNFGPAETKSYPAATDKDRYASARWRIQSGQNAGFVRSSREEFQRTRVCTDSVIHMEWASEIDELDVSSSLCAKPEE